MKACGAEVVRDAHLGAEIGQEIERRPFRRACVRRREDSQRETSVAVTAELIEVPHQRGPFGAKGMGETGTFAVSPAIANALYDAVGVRILEMPLTPERVLRAIRENEHRPLGNE